MSNLYHERRLQCTSILIWGRDSSVGIATRYGQDGPGIDSRWEPGFPHSSRPVLGPSQPPVHWALGLFSGGEAAVAWR
jgi:hypothetical protein